MIPQLNFFLNKVTGPKAKQLDEQLTISILILGEFPSISAEQALEINKSETRLLDEQLVAWYVHAQIVEWQTFPLMGVWLGIGDEVEHLNGAGVFRIERRSFFLSPQTIEFSVRYHPSA